MPEPTTIVGLHGAGPLTVSTSDEAPGAVHVGWPEGGMWLDRGRALALIDALRAAIEPDSLDPSG